MVARNLLVAGIARPELWVEARESATAFVTLTVEDWLKRHGRSAVERNFFTEIVLSDRADPNSWREVETMAVPRDLYITVHIDSAGYAVFGPTLRLLMKLHPRLAATFYHGFVASVEGWVRVYDYRDGLERVEQVRDWMSAEPEEQYEIPDVEGAMPAGLNLKPLGRRSLRHLAAETRGRAKVLLDGLVRLLDTADRGCRPQAGEQVWEQLQDNNPPVPALLAVFEKHDAIEGCFDEDSQTMLEAPPEPNVIIPVDGTDPSSLATAFGHLACMTETLAAASNLIERMPGNQRTDGGRE